MYNLMQLNSRNRTDSKSGYRGIKQNHSQAKLLE